MMPTKKIRAPYGRYDSHGRVGCRLLMRLIAPLLARVWPLGLVFADDLTKFVITAGYQTMLTHRSPEAQAASCALAVGMALSLRGASVDEMVTQMIEVAKKYELFVADTPSGTAAAQELTTSQYISYAYDAAKAGMHPDQVLVNCNNRLSM